MIKADVALEKDNVKALEAHILAVKARMDRLKKEQAQTEMAAQQH